MEERQHPWGKMSKGQPYILFATDLFRAFCALGLGEIEGTILGHVIENTWGLTAKRGRKGTAWTDTIPCQINVPNLQKTFDLDRQNAHKALARLLNSRVIAKVEGGYLVNKNVDEWVKPGTTEARIGRVYRDYAASSHKPDVIFKDDKPSPNVIFKDDAPAENVIFKDDIEPSHVISKDDKPDEPVIFKDDIAYKERAPGNPTGLNTNSTRSNTNRHTIGKRAKAKAHIPRQRGLALRDDDEPFNPPLEALPLPAPVFPDDPETASLIAKLHPYIIEATKSPHCPEGNPDTADFLVGRARVWRDQNYPGEVIRKAIEAGVDAGLAHKPIPLAHYALKVLASWFQKQQELATASPPTPPSQTKPMTYHTAPPRPNRARPKLEGDV